MSHGALFSDTELLIMNGTEVVSRSLFLDNLTRINEMVRTVKFIGGLPVLKRNAYTYVPFLTQIMYK